ncbi:uncharacterized protein [Haliotis cracherodii]|uniref:uncharacterized protein n=1 Tax=Haliotis cracherodii TaxID=6455 RepID=UPI0039ECAC2A
MMFPLGAAATTGGAAVQGAVAIVAAACVVVLLMYCMWIRGLKLPRLVPKRRTLYRNPVARYHSEYGVELDLDDADAYAYASVEDPDGSNGPKSGQRRTDRYDHIGNAPGVYEHTSSLGRQSSNTKNTSQDNTNYGYNHLNHKPKPKVLNHRYEVVVPKGLEAVLPSTTTASSTYNILGSAQVQPQLRNEYDVARVSQEIYSVPTIQRPGHATQPSETDVNYDSSDEENSDFDTDENYYFNNAGIRLEFQEENLSLGDELNQDDNHLAYALGTIMPPQESTSQIYDIPTLPLSRIGETEHKQKAVPFQKCFSNPETVKETEDAEQVYSMATDVGPAYEAADIVTPRHIRDRKEAKTVKEKPPIKKKPKLKTPARSVQSLATFYDTQLDACSLVRKPSSPGSDLPMCKE